MPIDSVPITPGAGVDVATDRVGGKDYQLVKVDTGALDSESGPAGGAANPFRVDPTGTTTQPVSGTVGVTGVSTSANQATMIAALAAIQTSLELIDTIVSSNRAQVDVVSSALPSGAATSAKQDTIIGHVDGIEGLLTTVAAANPLTDTQLRATPVPVSGTVTANIGTAGTLALETGGNLAAAAASLSVLDDWDETDRAKVNIIVGQAGVQGNSGAVSANTQRVVLATDVALPAGTNAIGKLAANDGVDIGNVDVASTTLPTGGTLTSSTTSITTTASIQVHSGTACKFVRVQNDPDNTNDMLIGTTGAESFQLAPGDSLGLAVSNVNQVYAKNVTSSTQVLNWCAIN